MSKSNNDSYRHFLDEIEAMIEYEKREFRELKESLKDSFTYESIPELLSKRRRAFDHAFVECINKYGFSDGNVRHKLDAIWNENILEQSKWKKYLRHLKILSFLNPIGQAAAILFDDTYKLKKAQWHSYLDGSLDLVKKMVNNND